MKKSKLKLAVRKAVTYHYAYLKGFTNTAATLIKEINAEIDKEYNKKHKKR